MYREYLCAFRDIQQHSFSKTVIANRPMAGAKPLVPRVTRETVQVEGAVCFPGTSAWKPAAPDGTLRQLSTACGMAFSGFCGDSHQGTC
jgi:hypothetical protein